MASWQWVHDREGGPRVSPSVEATRQQRSALGGDFLKSVLVALVVFVVVNALTGRYVVQSFSMEPTLHEGQYLLVSRIAYRLHPPQRGDIVVLDPPRHVSAVPYVKRIVGLPGEHIRIHGGRVWVDSVVLNEPYVSGPALYELDLTLGVGEYLVLGDNRNNSSDSHVWGVLPEDHIIGKAIFRYWPLSKLGVLPHYAFPEVASGP